jgi:hypothetical protein
LQHDCNTQVQPLSANVTRLPTIPFACIIFSHSDAGVKLSIDGLYSLAAVGVAGMSAIILKLGQGRIEGNDSAGARYIGTYEADGTGYTLTLEITSPPNSFGVFGSSASETFRTNIDTIILPASLFLERVPYTLPSYGITVIATRIPDTYADLAGKDGIRTLIGMLERADSAWKRVSRTV